MLLLGSLKWDIHLFGNSFMPGNRLNKPSSLRAIASLVYLYFVHFQFWFEVLVLGLRLVFVVLFHFCDGFCVVVVDFSGVFL